MAEYNRYHIFAQSPNVNVVCRGFVNVLVLGVTTDDREDQGDG